MKAFIARDSDGGLYLYYSNPYSKPPIKSEKILKTEKMWVSLYTPRNTIKIIKIDSMLFPEVKWEDEEPTEINIEIVNKHQ